MEQKKLLPDESNSKRYRKDARGKGGGMQGIGAIAQAVSAGSANLSGVGGSLQTAGREGNLASPEILSSPESVASPFAGLVTGAVDSMNRLNAQAASLTMGLVEGTGVGVSQAMIATEKADQAFELALAVRNKAVAAYQQVMNLQF
jgi:flagellar hook-basal body complex protein FliE